MAFLLPGACDVRGLGKTCFSLGSGFIADLPRSGDSPDSSSKLFGLVVSLAFGLMTMSQDSTKPREGFLCARRCSG